MINLKDVQVNAANTWQTNSICEGDDDDDNNNDDDDDNNDDDDDDDDDDDGNGGSRGDVNCYGSHDKRQKKDKEAWKTSLIFISRIIPILLRVTNNTIASRSIKLVGYAISDMVELYPQLTL